MSFTAETVKYNGKVNLKLCYARGGLYTWTAANPAPCHGHQFRVWVYTSAGQQTSWQLPRPLPALNLTQLQLRGGHTWRPAPPSQLQVS